MLEMFVYPVSVVMKLWHLLLHNLFGMEATGAWIVSIFGLIVTVRALIAPMTWMQKRSGRRSVLMRPELAALQERYGSSTDPQELLTYRKEQKALFAKYDHNIAAGCVPPLIQIPVFLGLYRLLLWLGRPESHESGSGAVGVLSAEDVAQFQEARFLDVPVAAYVAMPAERLASLGTTAEAVRDLVLPLLIAAVVFTALNMLIALATNWQTMNWASTASRRLFWLLIVLAVLTPALLLWIGLYGPIPLALVLYWFANNLWTLGQNVLMTWQLERRHPESDEHRAKRRADREALLSTRRQAREEKAALKRRRREIRRAPRGEAKTLRAQLAEEKRAAAEAAAKAKEEAQERRRAQRQARLTVRRQLQAEKKQRKQAPAPESGSDSAGQIE
ncbi:membrane protein insertase YidC [Corynebacterium guangdongense]|uniref:Membrane protein insertase YidC n=1 Tax=Corynebacterium guangdongense TaxID=1783348 RepID=A0ABU2A089_9CORY|nr:membrane protein insertase YidC [Corynebacterium guangdongense]MDR7330505.1 YidC/Oxa1 family membrane protein insertase [Corynebacterium guangdongense]WJZ19061.1 Membrane protein insertase YidC [Corynebacterium guangdongense]